MSRMLSNVRRRELSTVFDNMFNDLLSDFWKDVEWPGFTFVNKATYPRVNVKDESERFLIEAAVPGLTEQDVEVQYNEGVLTISGKNSNEVSENRNGYVVRELHKSAFTRSFRVDEEKFVPEKIEATVDNGLLSVTIPKRAEKKEEPKVKRIEVKRSGV